MIEIEVNITDVARGLTRLEALGRNMTPLTRDLAEVLKGAVDRAFNDEEDPATGAKWPELSARTKARRAKAGHTGKKLQVTGRLASSIHTEHGPDFARVGTGDERAPTHQYGAKKGAFGTAKRGVRGGRGNRRNYTSRGGATVGGWLSGRSQGGSVPIPFGDIPARPFLGIGKPEEAEIAASVSRAVRRAFGGA